MRLVGAIGRTGAREAGGELINAPTTFVVAQSMKRAKRLRALLTASRVTRPGRGPSGPPPGTCAASRRQPVDWLDAKACRRVDRHACVCVGNRRCGGADAVWRSQPVAAVRDAAHRRRAGP